MRRAAALGLILACAHPGAPQRPKDLRTVISEGHLVGAIGVKGVTGTPVEVMISFKDEGLAPCRMYGAVQMVRDTSHIWVWLEPTEGCPEWSAGRWWAEMATGAAGWYVANISSEPVFH